MLCVYLQLPLEMLRFLMHREAVALQVPIGGGHVGMASLVSCDDDSLSVGQVADSGILEGVELERGGPLQRLPHFCETLPENTA